jgi:hypothetical protein
MKKTAVLLFALLSGCWYDRPNPWRTESDRIRYLDKKEEDWLLEMKLPYELPQNPGIVFALPDLEGFRDTVLVNAGAEVLTRMRDQSVAKVAALQTRAGSMAPINETNAVPVYHLLWEAYVEKLRLQMIEDTLGRR